MVENFKLPKLVGTFIRQRREALGLSQRALGLLFHPPVTTQFISNVERGVTPLPPVHVPTLTKALEISEAELMTLLEREYAMKLSGRLGVDNGTAQGDKPQLAILHGDFEFMKTLYEAYRHSDEQTKQAFVTVCESMLKLPKRIQK